MKILASVSILTFLFFSCGKKNETISPQRQAITASVYASGTIKSKNQYQVFATSSGIVSQIFVTEGDTIKKDQPILSIRNEASVLTRENAQLAAELAEYATQAGRLRDLESQIQLAISRMRNDSSVWARQKSLWDQGIGSQAELDRAKLVYENSKTQRISAETMYKDEKKRTDIQARQAQKNLALSRVSEKDLIVKSNMDGRVYNLYKEPGELITPQTPMAIIGDAYQFILELQVDEYDIAKIKTGQNIFVSMDSYADQVFTAHVTRIIPIMNERSKTFTVEAVFDNAPEFLYPNLTLEANIVIETKENVIVLPRHFILNDQYVIRENGDTIPVTIGIRDYQYAEIVSGVSSSDILIAP